MLYKYFPIERQDVLRNGLVRFTQPGDFNDPFELHPSYDLMSKPPQSAATVRASSGTCGLRLGRIGRRWRGTHSKTVGQLDARPHFLDRHRTGRRQEADVAHPRLI